MPHFHGCQLIGEPAAFRRYVLRLLGRWSTSTLLWAKMQYGPPYSFNGFFSMVLRCSSTACVGRRRIRVLASRPVVAGAVVVLLAMALSRPSPFANVTTLGAGPGDD